MKSIALQIMLGLFMTAAYPLVVTAQEPSSSHKFTVKGRVINAEGNPVSDAELSLFSVLTQEEKAKGQDRITEYGRTDDEGRFSIEAQEKEPGRWRLYVDEPHAEDTILWFTPIYDSRVEKYLPTFRGQDINVDGQTEIDLGDVPLQVYYGQILLHLDPDKNEVQNPNLRLRILTARKDKIGEDKIKPEFFRNNDTAVAITLPEGQWYIGLMSDPSKGWREKLVTVTAALRQIPLNLYLDNNSNAIKRPPLSSKDPKSAYKELTEMGFQFTAEEFIERIITDNTEVVKLFLQAGMSPNVREERSGRPALMFAIEVHGSTGRARDIIDLLLKEKADINAKSDYGATALITAVVTYNEEMVKILLKRGATVDDQMKDGWTALMCAAYTGRIEIAKLLLKAGAKVNLLNQEEKTALKLAMENDETEMIDLLIKAGAKE